LISLKVLIEKFGAAALGIADLFALLLPKITKADQLLVVLHKSTHTAEIEKAVRERDSLFRALYEVIKQARVLTDADRQEAAESLYVLAAQYRPVILHKSYPESAGAVYNLLQDLRSNRYAPAVSLLGLGQWIDPMEAASRRFQSYWDERQQESIDKPKEHLAELRAEVDEICKSIMERLYSKLLADGLGGDVVIDPDSLKDGVYESDTPDHLRGNIVYNFAIAWNESLKKYHNLLAQRTGQLAKKQDEEEEEEPEEEQ
jgi:hypothetical protein